MKFKATLFAIITMCGTIITASLFALPKGSEKVIFTDPLYESWTNKDSKSKEVYTQVGTTALFDIDNTVNVIEDICGSSPAQNWTAGRAYDGHKGWDRNIPNDDNGVYPVFAIGPGVIEKVGLDCSKGDKTCNGGAGNFVRIRHNEHVVSKIFHLRYQKVFVSENQWVDRFHPIGLGGSTGNSSGEHVHVQIEIDGVAVDPTSLADQWSPKLSIDTNSCLTSPQFNLVTYQSLYDFVANKIVNLSVTLDMSGYSQLKEQHWLLESEGENEYDVIMEDYEQGGKKMSLFYDLIGHAPKAIAMPHGVLQWWFEHGSVYFYGKPIVSYPLKSASGENSGTVEFDFTGGYIKYAQGEADPIKEFAQYPEKAAPGMFIDGWKAGKSYAFATAFAKNGGSPKVGFPTGKENFSVSPYVHDWAGYSVQVFKGGTLGNAGIILQKSDDDFQAFLIYGKFWQTYHAPTMGIETFGPPLGDAYFDPKFNMLRQDFENGKTILETGEVILSNAEPVKKDPPKDPDPPPPAPDPCAKGICNAGDQESQICGKCSNGKKSRTCTSTCIWADWSACSDPDSAKLCCDNMKNACGGCASLAGQPNSSCGTNGQYQCDGSDKVICKETPITPPPKDPDPPSPQKNACGGTSTLSATPGTSCGKCGNWQCNGTDNVTCNASGVCFPGETSSQNCIIATNSLCDNSNGTQKKTCNNVCQWDVQVCAPAPSATQYAFDSKKVCGPKYCFQMLNTSGASITAQLSKKDGTVFGNMPLEWDVVNVSNSKVLATPFSSCNQTYTGQSSITVQLNLKYVVGQAQAKANFYSGPNCANAESTPTVSIEKCF